jgi:hypothetical protein
MDWVSDQALPWLGNAATDVWGYYKQNPWLQQGLSTSLNLGLSAYSASEQRKQAERIAQQNQALSQQVAAQDQGIWNQTAYPNAAAVNASALANRGELGQARLGASQNFFNNLAARGFMSGSGLGAKGQADIERGYAQSYGKMLTDLTKFKNTPITPLPSQGYVTQSPYSYYPQTSISPTMAVAGKASNYLDIAKGYTDLMNLYKQIKKVPENNPINPMASYGYTYPGYSPYALSEYYPSYTLD